MVYLSKIYTKTGDDGTTALGDGERRSKDDIRVESYGTVDELNATVGLLRTTLQESGGHPSDALLNHISNDLFDLGADLCIVPTDDETPGSKLRIVQSQIDRLENAIDQFNENLAPLTSFILPGGSKASAWCHLARTVCRRAERRVVTLSGIEKVNPRAVIYLNRLSDLLFVLGREFNNQGQADVLWKPGAGR